MNHKLRILLITDEAWNDRIHGNNVLSNWFTGFDADFAHVYGSSDAPCNSCCKRYFQITDAMMLRSIFQNEKAGRVYSLESFPTACNQNSPEKLNRSQRLRFPHLETMRAARDALWSWGRFDRTLLKAFIEDFNPDIVFSVRMANVKLLRLEQTVIQLAQKPIVVFTGDDEYSLQQLRLSPVYWIRRMLTRKKLRQTIPFYSLYYTLSDEQKVDYESYFQCPMKILRKCGDFSAESIKQDVQQPIRMIYAGKLYCHRWKSLAAIGDALKIINADQLHMTLDIYTKDTVSRKQKKQLHDGRSICLRNAILPEQLKQIYEDSDIALHVESFDTKNRLLTRVSFSTKIMDCLASGCAVMAVCWNQHAGLTYLKREDAAFIIDNKKAILPTLQTIVNHPESIREYAKKARECGSRNHQTECVQNRLMHDFLNIVEGKNGACGI